MRRLMAKKSKVLPLRIEVALLLRSKGEKIEYYAHPTGAYWKGKFKFNKVIYQIYFQLYTRRKTVDYVNIFTQNSKYFDPLYGAHGAKEWEMVYKLELMDLKKKLEGNQNKISDLRGSLSKQSEEEVDEEIQKLRDEWDRTNQI
jgi:hypothetical protein